MDVRTEIINRVVEALVGVEQDVIDRVEPGAHIQLQNYEVQSVVQRLCCMIAAVSVWCESLSLRKRLEGKSERTLKKYQPELERLVNF